MLSLLEDSVIIICIYGFKLQCLKKHKKIVLHNTLEVQQGMHDPQNWYMTSGFGSLAALSDELCVIAFGSDATNLRFRKGLEQYWLSYLMEIKMQEQSMPFHLEYMMRK